MDKDQKIKDLEKELADEKAARQQEDEERKKKEKGVRQSEFSSFVENDLIAKGRLPKDKKDEAVAFMMSLPAGNDEKADFTIGEGDDQNKKTFSSVQWFKDLCTSIKPADFTTDLPDDGKNVNDFARDDDGKLMDLTGHV